VSIFGDDFPEYRNPIMDMVTDAIGVLPPVIRRSADDIREADVAHEAVARRAASSGLTNGDVEDHLDAITTLATDVRGGEGDTRAQIADDIDRLRDDLQTVWEDAS